MKRLTAAAQHIFPDIRTISGCPTHPEVVIQGRSALLICSPNYLGLAGHPAVIGAFSKRRNDMAQAPSGRALFPGTQSFIGRSRKIWHNS